MKYHLPVLLSLTVLITGCFGGNSGGSGVSGGSSLGGIAATGAPIPNGAVAVKGGNGNVAETTTDSTGAYSVDVSDLIEPYLIVVTAISGEKLISVASQRDIEAERPVNVTPLSHAIVAKVFLNKNADDLFNNFVAESSDYSDTVLDSKKNEFKQSLIDAGVLGGSGVISDSGLDLMNGVFVAGSGNGMDRLLDALDVNLSAGNNVEIKFKGGTTLLVSASTTTNAIPTTLDGSTELGDIGDQLDALAQIKAFLVSAGAQYAAMIPCNGPAVTDGSSCDKGTLHTTFVNMMDAGYSWNGTGRAADAWDFFCKQSDGGNGATSAGTCNWIEAGNITFKDVTIQSYDSGTGIASISYNAYMDGVYEGGDEEFLKYDGTN